MTTGTDPVSRVYDSFASVLADMRESANAHTPEPWSPDCLSGTLIRIPKANQERIVACVNACAGLEDPAAALAEVRAALTIAVASGPLWNADAGAAAILHGALAKLRKS